MGVLLKIYIIFASGGSWKAKRSDPLAAVVNIWFQARLLYFIRFRRIRIYVTLVAL